MLTRWVGRRCSPFPVPVLTPEGLTGEVGKQNILAVIQWPGPGVFSIAVMSETPRFSCTSKWILVCSFFCPSAYYPAWSIFSICPGLSASVITIPPTHLSVLTHLPFLHGSLMQCLLMGVLMWISAHTASEARFLLSQSLPPPPPNIWSNTSYSRTLGILDAPCGHLLNVFHGHDFLESLFMLTVTGYLLPFICSKNWEENVEATCLGHLSLESVMLRFYERQEKHAFVRS